MTRAPLAPERWRRIEEIFHASSDIPLDQRDSFLRQACGPDDQLRIEIESLLDADFQESPLIAGIVDDATANLFEEDASRQHTSGADSTGH